MHNYIRQIFLNLDFWCEIHFRYWVSFRTFPALFDHSNEHFLIVARIFLFCLLMFPCGYFAHDQRVIGTLE